MTIYLATGLTQGAAQPMEDERIETKWFSRKELRELIRTNKITDAKTMIGFLHWARLVRRWWGKSGRGKNNCRK